MIGITYEGLARILLGDSIVVPDEEECIAKILSIPESSSGRRIYFEIVDSFPVEATLWNYGAKEGYSGGNRSCKVIRGTYKVKGQGKVDDQYTTGEKENILLYDEEGIAIIRDTSDWMGTITYTIFCTQEKKRKIEERVKQMRKQAMEKKERFLEETTRDLKKIRKPLDIDIDMVLAKAVKGRLSEEWVNTFYERLKFSVSLYDNEDNEVVNIYEYEYRSGMDCDYILEVKIGGKRIIKIQTETRAEWVQLGYSGPSELVTETNDYVEGEEYFGWFNEVLRKKVDEIVEKLKREGKIETIQEVEC